jgi:general secretion pathway protein A
VYNAFFGFDADPFRVNPDPRFLYMSESHAEALATLVYAVQERKGFITLTGEVGTGKTTILNALLQKLGPSVQTAYIFNTSLGVGDLFAALFEELELEWQEPFRKTPALSRLNHHLIERLTQGLQTLLIVDEAQNLSDEMLEEIRMLSNLETPQSKLLQIMRSARSTPRRPRPTFASACSWRGTRAATCSAARRCARCTASRAASRA